MDDDNAVDEKDEDDDNWRIILVMQRKKG